MTSNASGAMRRCWTFLKRIRKFRCVPAVVILAQFGMNVAWTGQAPPLQGAYRARGSTSTLATLPFERVTRPTWVWPELK